MIPRILSLLIGLVFISACSKKIYPDRNQFLKDGETAPTIDLSYYKSVQEREGQNPDLAIAVAISGGGARAANYGVGALLGLENIQIRGHHDVLDEVDYLSTVSGGGFAAGSYINALYDHFFYKRKEPFSLKTYVDRQINEALTYSYTAPLVRALFNPRFWVTKLDDGDALEKAIDDNVLGYSRRRAQYPLNPPRSILLSDMFIPIDSSHLPVHFPMQFANCSVLSTMAIFPFTPDVLQCYQVTSYIHRFEFIEDPELNHFSIPLAVAIKASGSFPVLISDSAFGSSYNEERPYLHIIDGAMTDNNGYVTALEILEQEEADQKVLLIVDADATGNVYTFSEDGGAVPALSVYAQMATSGLYARRALLEKDLIETSIQSGIKVVFVGFNVLIKGNDAIPPKTLRIKEEQKRLIELLKKDFEALTPIDCQILYDLLVNIDTKYSMTETEQELLLLAGQFIVHQKRDEILRAVGLK